MPGADADRGKGTKAGDYLVVSTHYEKWALHCYLGAVFVYSFAGVGPGRMLLTLSMILWALYLLGTRTRPVIPTIAWWALAYSAWVTLAILWGPAEGRDASQFYKHVAWLNIPLAYAVIRTTERRRQLLWALILGSIVLTLRVATRAVRVWQDAREAGIGIDPDHWFERVFHHTRLDGTDLIGRLIDIGGMQDGQRLALGLLAALCAAWMGASNWRGRLAVYLPVPFIALGLILSFKRGPWFALLALVLGWLVVTLVRRTGLAACVQHPTRRWIAIPLVALAVLLGLHAWMPEGPSAKWEGWQQQIENSVRRGGRVCMWTEITPAIVKEYPFGIGYKALTNEKMRSIARHVESNQSHVHSNVLQAAVDGGWPGLFLFAGWMWCAFRDNIRYVRRTKPGTADRSMAWTFLWMFTVLFLIGFVEYQLGSGQITMMYGTLMGCSAAAAAALRDEKTAPPEGSDG